MRKREEIVEHYKSNFDYEVLTLEVLLDIRELLEDIKEGRRLKKTNIVGGKKDV